MGLLSEGEVLEFAASAYVDWVMRGTPADEAIEAVCGTREFERVADLIRAERERFVDFAWDLCG